MPHHARSALVLLFPTTLATLTLACGASDLDSQQNDGSSTNNASGNNSNNNTDNTNNDTNGGTNNTNSGTNNDQRPRYRYVLLEDLSEDVNDTDAPGADIDAIAIERDWVDIAYAAVVENSNIGGANNAFADPNNLLGPPDSECMKKNFTSLGGAPNDGWVIVSFDGGEALHNGDNIIVYELGPSVCPGQPTWKDDGFEVSISVSVEDPGDGGWIYLMWDGANVIPVYALDE